MLAAIEQDGASELWCLGDLVGYNADPVACTIAVTEVADICLAGNHDLVVNGSVDLSVFAHDAAIAARWNMQTLTPPALELLRALEPSGERHGVELFHASPRDPVWEYVIDPRTAQSCLELLRHDLCLIGHSHVPLAYSPGSGGRAGGGHRGPGTLELGDGRWILNPGSVGQPRDGDPRAAYMVLDLDAGTATLAAGRLRHRPRPARDRRGGPAGDAGLAAGRGPLSAVRPGARSGPGGWRGRSPPAAARRRPSRGPCRCAT